MNKKGFTLIELLAVIVILAIIALIATPIVLNIIEDSKKSSKLNSANHYVDAVEQAIMKENMSNGGNFIPQECEVQSDGNLKCDGKDITVEVDGEKPTSGKVQFLDGEIKVIGLRYASGEYFVSGDNGALIDREPPQIKTYYANGEPVYYNVDTGKTCLESEAVSTTGTKSGCMKFYAFNDVDGNESVNLLLDHNTTGKAYWNSSGSNNLGPNEVLTTLYNDTKNWVGTITPSDYTMDQRTQSSGAYYTVEYSKTPSIEGATVPYKARLITAQEIAQITGNKTWDETLPNEWYCYFDTLTTEPATACIDNDETTECKYGWLYDRTANDCTNNGCLNNSDVQLRGYWTVSSSATYKSGAWNVKSSGNINDDITTGATVNTDINAGGPSSYGVRPVIGVLKSNLSQ